METVSWNIIPVGGRLSHFHHFWDKNIRDKWTRSVVKWGYSVEFLTLPHLTTSVSDTNLSPQKEPFLLKEIDEMLIKNAIEEVDPLTPGFYSTFFLIAKKDGGQRPIINLKGLNKFIQVKTFRMQTPQSVLSLLRQGDWLASLDLKDAYFHVPILHKHRRYLQFAYQSKIYQFKVFPFGMLSSPRVSRKVLNPLVGYLHQEGVRIYPYLDDCLLVARSRDILLKSIQKCLWILDQAGFLINYKKSHLVPVQNLVFLGVTIASVRTAAILPLEKAQLLVMCTKLFMKAVEYRPVRLYLRLLGLMTASMTASIHMLIYI